MSIEAELASLASYSSLGNGNVPMDSSINEFEMTRKHAQRQCGRFGKKVEISSNTNLAFLLYSGALEFPAPRNFSTISELRGHTAYSTFKKIYFEKLIWNYT